LRVFARPDPSKVREFADDVRDAAEAQVLAEKGGVGKVILLAPGAQTDTSLSDRTS
jgi:hypothetical protein